MGHCSGIAYPFTAENGGPSGRFIPATTTQPKGGRSSPHSSYVWKGLQNGSNEGFWSSVLSLRMKNKSVEFIFLFMSYITGGRARPGRAQLSNREPRPSMYGPGSSDGITVAQPDNSHCHYGNWPAAIHMLCLPHLLLPFLHRENAAKGTSPT